MFGDRLKQAIKDAGLTQHLVAKAVNMSQASVAKWTSNTRTPDPETITQLAKILGVDANYLLLGDTEGKNSSYGITRHSVVMRMMPYPNRHSSDDYVSTIRDDDKDFIMDRRLLPRIGLNRAYGLMKMKYGFRELIKENDLGIFELLDIEGEQGHFEDGIYVLFIKSPKDNSERVTIFRCQFDLFGNVTLIPDNKSYNSTTVEAGQFKVFARYIGSIQYSM